MADGNWQAQLPKFDQLSYYAGVTAAFSEIVAAGVKPLALSHPYSKEELYLMREPTRQIAAEYGVVTWVEDSLLVTPLFPADVALGKFVILLAQNKTVLERYTALKVRHAAALQTGTLDDIGEELAHSFGNLLGYSNAAIEKMLRPESS